jgi:NADPH-dependent 2,4-dienoyl-CoA reductase/sulfur reductase-like enzyme
VRRLATDVAVLGAGPAGLAAACAAAELGSRVVIIEREERLGGILKQCVHDGFGLERYRLKLSGPEYSLRDADRLAALGVEPLLEVFVSRVERTDSGFTLTCVDRGGVLEVEATALVLATGCRERTDRQVFIHGDRPAGIYTAGLAQYFMNVQGLLPGKRAVILGSGDIGLIMARRMILEGMDVLGVYEIKPEPSGLSRNIRQCLDDFGVPLELSTTITSVHGSRRVSGVTTAKVDAAMRPVPGTERDMPCDTLILSVGLIPENELASALGVPLDPATKGPKVDQSMHTLVDGVFACGNAVHVNDLADYVSESGETAGRAAASWAASASATASPASSRPSSASAAALGDGPGSGAAGGPIRASRERRLVPVERGPGLLYAVPQYIDVARVGGPAGGTACGGSVGGTVPAGGTVPRGGAEPDDAVFYFRAASTMLGGGRVRVSAGDGSELFARRYAVLRPPEMERFIVSGDVLAGAAGSILIGLDEPEAAHERR